MAENTPHYRCTACGNLTRFDVVETRQTKSFYHYSVGGELEVEDVEVLSSTIESATCRWCNSGEHVVENNTSDLGSTVNAGDASQQSAETAPAETR